jgi:hypothetical protein
MPSVKGKRKKENDLCIIDVALGKAGAIFCTWLTRGGAGNACAVMSRKISEQQKLIYSYFYVKQENCTCISAFSSPCRKY